MNNPILFTVTILQQVVKIESCLNAPCEYRVRSQATKIAVMVKWVRGWVRIPHNT
jgi:hypothetical protein